MKTAYVRELVNLLTKECAELRDQAKSLAYHGIADSRKTVDATRKLQEVEATLEVIEMVKNIGAAIPDHNQVSIVYANLKNKLETRRGELQADAASAALASADPIASAAVRNERAAAALTYWLQEIAIQTAIAAAEKIHRGRFTGEFNLQ